MKQRRKRFCSILCVCLFLIGCTEAQSGNDVGSLIWDEMPALEYGSLYTEKLTRLSWNSGRTEATSVFNIAETEKGWYKEHLGWLYFADKANPSSWIPVCGKPDCDHQMNCTALMEGGEFSVTDNGIQFLESQRMLGPVEISIVEMGYAGNDKHVVKTVEEAKINSEGGFGTLGFGNQWIIFTSQLNSDGTYQNRGIRVTENGSQVFLEKNGTDVALPRISSTASEFALYGDQYFYSTVLDQSGSTIFRFDGDALVQNDISGLTVFGGYLSGNTLRYFQPGDGYYDVDIVTREETRLCDAQTSGGYAAVLLPNCILESSLLYPASRDTRIPGMEHQMAVFDGQQWHDVTLPEELRLTSQKQYLSPLCVTSDAVLLGYTTTEKVFVEVQGQDEPDLQLYCNMILYRIPLGMEEWKLEYCGTLYQPKV